MNTYIMPTGQGWEPYRTLSNDERYGQWAMQYFGCGHHRARNDSTARNKLDSDTAAKRQDGTLSKPLIPTPAPGSRIAEAGLITNEV